MSRRVSLKEFQEGLAGRLRAASTEPAQNSRLGFEAGGQRWLVRLDRSGEVLQVPEIQRVPLTRPWFLGVANIRGTLFGVTDFAPFAGQAATPRGPENRLLLVGQPFGTNCALLVSRLTGLRNVADYTPEARPAEEPAWSAGTWRDKEARLWCELDVERLLALRGFLDIALH